MEFENLKSELLSKIDTSLKYAVSIAGAADVELYLFYRNEAKVNIEEGVVSASDGQIAGNAVRLATGSEGHKKISFSSSSGLDIDQIKKNIKEALSLNRSMTIEDNRFKSFCFPEKPGKEGPLSDEILSFSGDRLPTRCAGIIKDAKSVDNRIKTVEVEARVFLDCYAVGNTNGVNQASRSANNMLGIDCMAVDTNGDRVVAYDYKISREKMIDPSNYGEYWAKRALSFLGGKKIDTTAVLPTIWNPDAAAAYTWISIGQVVCGGNIVEGNSPYIDKIGEQVTSPAISVIDDGQTPFGILTNAIDEEGCPQRKTTIIENGVLKNYLFNSYYAEIFGSKPTGNATRRAFGSDPPYELNTSVTRTNLEVQPSSNKSQDDLVASIDGKGLLILGQPMGIHTSSFITGNFSVVINQGFLVENGEIKHPVKGVSVSGNFYDGWKNIREVAADSEVAAYFRTKSPSILFDGFTVTG
ncbi:MAG: TldD/PmbA family protein [Candidatus Hodarchaeales archaeon]